MHPTTAKTGICTQNSRVSAHVFFFSSRRRHTRCSRDWSSDVCSSDLLGTRLWIERNSPNAEYRRASTHRNQRPYAPGNLTLASAVSNFAGVEPDRQPELAEGQPQLQVWVSIPAAQRQLRGHPRSAG